MGCTAKLTTRQRRFVQTDAVSQFTKQLHSAVQLPSPYPVLLGAFRRGLSRSRPLLRSAPQQAELSDGLLVFGCWLFAFPFCMRLGRGVCGVALAPKSARASSPSLPRLFERSALARSEFRGTPRKRHGTGCPSQSEGSQAAGAHLWPTFLGDRKVGRPPGEIRPAKNKSAAGLCIGKHQTSKPQRTPVTTSQLNPNFCKYLRNRSASFTTARCAREA